MREREENLESMIFSGQGDWLILKDEENVTRLESDFTYDARNLHRKGKRSLRAGTQKKTIIFVSETVSSTIRGLQGNQTFSPYPSSTIY